MNDDFWPDGLPDDPAVLSAALKTLSTARGERKEEHREVARRARFNGDDRQRILRKTGGRCHICGGRIDDLTDLNLDHVLAHSGGGAADPENYLPAHGGCNNYRWDYLPREFQIILKLGVWMRTQIERQTRVGKAVAEAFLKHERTRIGRRKSGSPTEEDREEAR